MSGSHVRDDPEHSKAPIKDQNILDQMMICRKIWSNKFFEFKFYFKNHFDSQNIPRKD